MTDDPDRLQELLNRRLSALGSTIQVDLPNHKWHIESVGSIHHDVSCLLVIENSAHEDAAVLSVKRSADGARWSIDAVGVDAVWLGDVRDIPDRLNELMSSDLDTFDWLIGQVGRALIDAIVDHLRASNESAAQDDSPTTRSAT